MAKVSASFDGLSGAEKALACVVIVVMLVLGFALGFGIMAGIVAAVFWGVNTLAGYTVVAITLKNVLAGAVVLFLLRLMLKR